MIVSEQGRNLCLFFIIGLLIGFFFDIFRGFRKTFKIPNIFVDFQDILFLLISGWMYFRSILLFNHGELRFYIIISTIVGIVIYALTLSESCVIIIKVIFKLIKLLLEIIWKLLKIPYMFVLKNITKIFDKSGKKVKKSGKRYKHNHKKTSNYIEKLEAK